MSGREEEDAPGLERCNSQDLTNFVDPGASNTRELYRALRGSKADDALEDELLWEGDYMAMQRENMQRQQEAALLERLERRIGGASAGPSRPVSGTGAGTGARAASAAPRAGSAGHQRPASGLSPQTSVPAPLAPAGAPARPGAQPRVHSATAAGPLVAGIQAGGPPPLARRMQLPPSIAEGCSASGAVAQRSGAGGIPELLLAPGIEPPQSVQQQQLLMPTQQQQQQQQQQQHMPTQQQTPTQHQQQQMPMQQQTPTQQQTQQAQQAKAQGQGSSRPPPGLPAGAAAAGRRVTADLAQALAAAAATAASSASGAPSKAATPRAADGASPRIGLLRDEGAATGDATAEVMVMPVSAMRRSKSIAALKDGAGAVPEEADPAAAYGRLQRWAIALSTHPDFELLVILLIFANCVTLSLFRPLEPADSRHNKRLELADLVLNGIFTAEMLLRIAAVGGPLAYCKQPWNVFDLVMIGAGYTTFIPMGSGGGEGLEGVRALRALRALRPLRTITRFPSLRSIVVCFLEAVPLLLSVVGMLSFFIFIFGVTGTELFGGMYHKVCMDTEGRLEVSPTYEGEFGCGSRHCPDGYTCQELKVGTNTNVAGFNNVGFSFLTVFQCMTLSGWTYVMYRAMDSVGGYAVTYFALLVVFGAYFVLNLFLAVLKIKFAKAQSLLVDKRKAAKSTERPSSIIRLTKWVLARMSAFTAKRSEGGTLNKHLVAVSQASGTIATPRSRAGSRSLAGGVDPLDASENGGTDPRPAGASRRGRTGGAGTNLDRPGSAAPSLARSGSGASSVASGVTRTSGATSRYSAKVVLISAEEFDLSLEGVDMHPVKRQLLRAQYRLRLLVESSAFTAVFLGAILVNTVLLAIEHDGMSHELTVALSQANYALTGLFCLELVLKVAGLGLWGYFSDYWNQFDALVVAFSLLELGLIYGGGATALRSMRSMRVLKSFRVLRVVKMFRYLDSLQQIAKVLITSINSFAAIVVLLGLFWLVFSIVGLHVFGGLELAPPGWPNCDSLINSAILNFHTLNLENYEMAMFMIIRASNYGAAAYFISWIVLGKFILLALFLAVMLEAFENKYQHQTSSAGGFLARIKAVGRCVASAATAATSAVRSTRSAFSGGAVGQGGGKSTRFGPGAASLAVREPGPMAEATEQQAGGRDVAVVLRGGAAAAAESAGSSGLRRRWSAAGSGGGGEHVGSTRARRLPRGISHATAMSALAPPTVAALNSLSAGALPPPFVFPDVCRGTHAPADGRFTAAPAAAAPVLGQPCGPAAQAQEPAPRALLDLLVAAQLEAEQKQASMEARAAGIVDSLMPWRRWHWLGGGDRTDGGGCKRSAGGAHTAQPRGRLTGAAAAAQAATHQHEDDGSYSWREFFDTLAAIGMTPGTGQPASAHLAAGSSWQQAPAGCAAEAASASNMHGPTRRRAAACAGPVAEGTEGGSGGGGARRSLVPSLSFHSSLVSLIAEAEQVTSSRDTQQAGAACTAGGGVGSGGASAGGGPSVKAAQPAAGAREPSPLPSVSGGWPTQVAERAGVSGARGGWPDGGGKEEDEPLPRGFAELKTSGPGRSSSGGQAAEPPAPQTRWAHLQDDGSGPGSSRGARPGVQPHSPPISARPDRGRTPRPAHIRFEGPAVHGPCGDGAQSTANAPAFLEAALASLGEVGSCGAGAAGGGRAAGGGGGVRFADNAPAVPASMTTIDALLAADDGDALDVAMRTPSITVKALKKRREAALAGASESARATPLPGAAADGGAAPDGCASGRKLPAKAGLQLPRADSGDSGSLRSESQGSHVSGASGSSHRRSGSDYSFASRRTDAGMPPPLQGRSLWLLPEDSLLRLWLYDAVTSRRFDWAMNLLILLNCVAMAYEHPHLKPGAVDTLVLYWSDVAFTVLFGVEALMKIMAFTFRIYWAQLTNKVDLTIVATSVLLLALDTLQLEAVKALRVLRAAKPLRALTRSAGMRLVFKSVTMSLAAMANVSLVVALFFLIFAILGVQLFSGKFWACTDASVPDHAACVGNFTSPATGRVVERRWENAELNFDHLGKAMVSLFVVATLNGYSEPMDAAMASPHDKGMQPAPMNNWSVFFYFVAFVIVVSYTLLNLYIGVVFFQFSRIRAQSQNGSVFMTGQQQEWVELSKMVFRLKPPDKCPVPRNRIRRRLYFMVQAHWFEVAIMVLIVANALLMATTHYGESKVMVDTAEKINYVFTCVFILEAALKLAGLGFENYWKTGWNRFDALLVASGLADMLVSLLGSSQLGALKVQKVLRLMRLARVVKLVRSAKGVRSLFGTLIVSMPAFWNVGALLGLLFYIYAYIGTLLLGQVKHNGSLNSHANFERFWWSLLTLLRVATTDNWANVYEACLVRPPHCEPEAGNCGSWVAIPFFISFVLLVSIVMLNLFTAVIIENFEKQQEQEAWRLNPQSLEEFVNLWSEYDDGSGSIEPRDLEMLLLRLHPPLGLGPGAEGKDVLRFVFDLDIPLVAGRVPFHRTVFELVKRCSGTSIPEGVLKDQIDRMVARHFKNMRSDEVLNFSVAVTVMRVQRKWRARMRAAKLKRTKESRANRAVVPAYADVVAARDTALEAALALRQDGAMRWRPAAHAAPMWDAAEAALRERQRAAAESAATPAALPDGGAGGGGGDDEGFGGALRRLVGRAGSAAAGGRGGAPAGTSTSGSGAAAQRAAGSGVATPGWRRLLNGVFGGSAAVAPELPQAARRA